VWGFLYIPVLIFMLRSFFPKYSSRIRTSCAAGRKPASSERNDS
jgi:hypothetical protein